MRRATRTMHNIPTELLRTFVELIETKNFSQAADRIGRTQSTVSLQMKRLQEIAGSPLITSSGKNLTLTQSGAILQSYARQMLRLNDECMQLLEGKALGGTIRIGIPSDFAIALLPGVIGRFALEFPDVALEVTCRASNHLIEELESGSLDIVVAVDTYQQSRHLKSTWTDPVVWVGRISQQVHTLRPLPLVLFPAPCQYRAGVIWALTQENIPFRVAFSSASMAANHSAIDTGIGLTALSRNSIPPSLSAMPLNSGLPQLPDIGVGLFWVSRGATKATRKLAEFLENILQIKLANPDKPQLAKD